jgi:hypothetical protein
MFESPSRNLPLQHQLDAENRTVGFRYAAETNQVSRDDSGGAMHRALYACDTHRRRETQVSTFENRRAENRKIRFSRDPMPGVLRQI